MISQSNPAETFKLFFSRETLIVSQARCFIQFSLIAAIDRSKTHGHHAQHHRHIKPGRLILSPQTRLNTNSTLLHDARTKPSPLHHDRLL
ncbi:hypothetical protein M758_7G177100 [Ceratodon purpureus]|nr:hypothetical protein M758_7G177100 [Ceratodon purpureus]